MEQFLPASSSSSSSSSCSSKPLPAAEFEVFLSFRGPDVRTTFADFLYRYLNRSNIRTFMDDEELHQGEKIAPSLVKAIEESKIYIPILSKDYCSSKWCLQELSLMVKCWKQGKGHVILPIFYLVQPRDVRHQKGSYLNAFRRHSKKYDAQVIKEWKEALEVVGNMKGWHVTESDGQGAVIDQVFSKVWSHLTRDYMLATDDLIGIDSHLEKLKKRLLSGYEGVKVIGIHGMGGIGKTTIAKALYNDVCAQFDHYCFLEDVRQTLLKTDGIETLQKKIIYNVLRLNIEINDADEGINIIKSRICNGKVLIILDDVDDKFKFERILGKLEYFCSESRFIITTRDKRVMDFFQEYELYEPVEMNEDHSLQVFSRHAFGMNYPPKGDIALSMKFVKVAAGLPLALKVIGSLLFRKDHGFWKAKLKQLEHLLPLEVQETLRISYLELSHEEKQVFLDIACFFVGEEKVRPFYMWRDCGFHPEIVITTLIQRSLIKINQNVFWMHDHIRDLGKLIILEEDFQCPWKRSRIWSNDDALDMLTDEKVCAKLGTDRLEVLKVRANDIELTDRQFEKLSGLRYLKVEGGGLSGNFERTLPNLRWLQLHLCNWIPKDLNMKKLVILDLNRCSIDDDWKGWKRIKEAQKLRYITLSYCRVLRTDPDLSHCGNLEFIYLEGCKKISGELHIGNLKNLKVLSLTETIITELTGDIGMLQNLQEINVVDSKLRKLPTGIGRLSSLEFLYLLSDQSLEIPADIWKLSKLQYLKLWLCSCTSLLAENGMDAAALPSSLNRLTFDLCRSLERLPNLANLKNLTALILTGTKVREILGLGDMRKMQTLQISHCPDLSNLDGLQHLVLLKTLSLSCSKLEKLPSLSNMTKLDTLEVTHCWLLSEIHGLGELRESLLCLKIRDCPRLAYTKGLGFMKLASDMGVLLPSLSNLGKLRKLILGLNQNDPDQILSQEQYLDLSGLHSVKVIYITSSNRLTELGGLERLEMLESLSVSHCSAIRKLSDLSALKNMKKLDIHECMELTDLMGLENLHSLQELSICNCTSITKLPDLSCFKHLNVLEITGCTQLTEVTGIEKLKELKWLTLDERFKINH
ncbi:Disease resistance protein L6 [Linum perenne]